MKGDTTGKTSKAEPRTDWRRLRGMSDEEIHAAVLDDPEIRATDEDFWRSARVVIPQRKETVTMRLDADLLAWFRQQRGYQTRINAILRAYMNAHAENR
ncbi:MAG TPA: BrnA antitoxin family protein [Stellaceae bacterium]|nr:BrnA antitoxin family protein [Stellaceae bacterium]